MKVTCCGAAWPSCCCSSWPDISCCCCPVCWKCWWCGEILSCTICCCCCCGWPDNRICCCCRIWVCWTWVVFRYPSTVVASPLKQLIHNKNKKFACEIVFLKNETLILNNLCQEWILQKQNSGKLNCLPNVVTIDTLIMSDMEQQFAPQC